MHQKKKHITTKASFLFTVILFFMAGSIPNYLYAAECSSDESSESLCSESDTPPSPITMIALIKSHYIPSKAITPGIERHPTILENRVTIEKSIKYFKETKGFKALFIKVLRNSTMPSVKGYMYELKRAISLHEQFHEEDPIIEFGCMKSIEREDGTIIMREFDIETAHYSIECKCRNIGSPPNHPNTYPKSIENRLLDQKEVIDYLNLHGSRSVTFQLSSHNPLPKEWHDWLEQYNIELHEGL